MSGYCCDRPSHAVFGGTWKTLDLWARKAVLDAGLTGHSSRSLEESSTENSSDCGAQIKRFQRGNNVKQTG